MSQNTVIGKVAITPQGNFQLGSTYSRLSVVSYGGSSYIAIQDNQNVPVTDTSNWYLLASKGKGISNIVLQSTIDNISTYRVNYDDGTYYDFDIHNGPEKTSELENNGSDGVHPFITKNVNNLTNYELKGNVGTSLELSLNNSTYVITLKLKNYAGTVLNTSTIDLPLESDIVGGSYSGGVLTLTKRSGGTIQLSFNDLVPTSRTIAGLDLTDDITADELITALSVYTKTEVDTLLVPINAKLDLIESNYDTAVANGNPIEINDSLNGFIQDPQLFGNTTQNTTTGRNLLNVAENLSVTGSKSVTVNLPAGTYYVTCKSVTKGGENNPAFVGMGNWFYITNNLNKTVTLTDSVTQIKIFSNNYDAAASAGVTSTMEQLMISTDGGDYEPYTGGQPSPSPNYPQSLVDVTGAQEIVVSNKNIALNDNPNNPDANYVSSGSGSAAVNYSSSNEGYYTTTSRMRQFVFNKPGTYQISVAVKQRSDGSGNNAVLYRTSGDPTYRSFVEKSSTNANYQRFSKSFTVTSPITIMLVFYSTVYWNDIQVEEGITATDYVPHKGLSTTLRLGDIHLLSGNIYEDRIYSSNGKWYLHKEFGIAIYDGSESWSQRVNNGGRRQFAALAVPQRPAAVLSADQKCNYGVYSSGTYNYGNLNSFVINNNNRGMNINVGLDNDESTITLEQWKTQLATTNLVSIFPLATSTDTEITSQNYPELYEDLQSLLNVQTYKNYTIITISPISGAIPTLQVAYWVDNTITLESRIASLESRVALLE